ncbi:MAG: alpha/beta hydrolase-fold protein [candidate division KSB1 bacterium]|nr:alpha/beta hydrolase-fold protein [candidate division KSB1 bacterium]MDZ7273909.1 alpha/beta hydrolase-fold protein [candidate division KSB1 bacterium]MDZ7286065.1 alpha/beta hydrolase-fold protein [candidate division KSB1 bacterium]MDZ7299097.1 alpha/beta hydrolase-fold protein [candidate division KSB1 bacterium]MDZ7349758.1 alpha/beta hydrolase-fold protein [candidate division KSB1 bacterium]
MITPPKVKHPVLVAALLLLLAANGQTLEKSTMSRLRFAISFSAEKSPRPLDGRLLLMISVNDEREPRFQISDDPGTQQIFGIDVEGLKPGQAAFIDAGVFGYPLKSLAELKPGEYMVQALLHKYETFHLASGHTVKLPMDRGEGQQWNRAPGNLYSTPQRMMIDPRRAAVIKINLDQEIPPIPPPQDTKYIKHVKMHSERLTKFWGRPMELGACVLLPEGFEEHPEARYPLMIFHGHFPYTLGGFREQPPDPNLVPEYSTRFRLAGYNKIVQEYAHQFYKDWTGPDFPRVIVIEIQHANPYYDDSYAVNSANLGPYGDAITYELIPFIERKFRGLGAGWARFLYGGSTGGWEALAAQIFYPEEYNGCFAACPDPIDFRAYTVVNIYEHKNAYYQEGPFQRVPRPGRRNYLGEVSTTVEQSNHLELVLGTNSRSGQQWDIWEAVFSPMGENGYPKRIWNKLTGEIDPQVAAYWRENYDLGYILRRDWHKLGPKLRGKIHLYCGDMDNYYLNNAVYLVEEFLESTSDPPYDGEIDYGDRAEHCWNGDHTRPIAISRLRYHQMFIPRAIKRLLATAPPGADLSSWRY